MALIAGFGLTGAAAAVGAVMVMTAWWLSGRYLGRTPDSMGLLPDGDAPGIPAPVRAGSAAESLPGAALWRSRRFVTLTTATSLGLFAQIGLIAHLFSLLVPALGVQLAGFAAGLATACAIAGRTGMGWLLPPGADRGCALALNYGLQLCGSLVLLAAGGTSIPLLLLGVVLFGLGQCNATSLPPLIVQQDFAPADTARAVALVTACSQACCAIWAPRHQTWAAVPRCCSSRQRSSRSPRRAPSCRAAWHRHGPQWPKPERATKERRHACPRTAVLQLHVACLGRSPGQQPGCPPGTAAHHARQQRGGVPVPDP